MNFFDGTLIDLLKPEYGGEEVFGDEVNIVSQILNTTPDKVIFTTSDEAYDDVDKFTHHLFENEVELNFNDVSDYDHNYGYNDEFGFIFIYSYAEGGLSSVFIKSEDKLKFEEFVNNLK